MSVSTRSAKVVLSKVSASWPLAASPTTSSGTALLQSSSTSRSRCRAGASSSTMSTLSGASGTHRLALCPRSVRHADVHFVALPVHFALEARLCVEVQRQPFTDVGQRHLVAAMVATARLIGIAQNRMHLAAPQEYVNRDHPGCARRLDAVIDRVLEQWLQHQRRNQRVAGHVVDMPLDAQPVAEAQFLEIEVLSAQRHLVEKGSELAVVAHEHPEQVGHVFERRLGSSGLAAHQ